MSTQHPDRRPEAWLDPTRVAFACTVVLVAMVAVVVWGSGQHATSDRAGLDSLDDPAAGFTDASEPIAPGDDDRVDTARSPQSPDRARSTGAPAHGARPTPTRRPPATPRPTGGGTTGGGTGGTGGAPAGPGGDSGGGTDTGGAETGTGGAAQPVTPTPQVPVGPAPTTPTPQPIAQLTDVLAPVVDPVLGVVRATAAPVAPRLVTPLLDGLAGGLGTST